MSAASGVHEEQSRSFGGSSLEGIGARNRDGIYPPAGGPSGSPSPTLSDGRQLCPSGKQTSLQAGALAATMATADPGLADCRRAKHHVAMRSRRRDGDRETTQNTQ